MGEFLLTHYTASSKQLQDFRTFIDF